MKTLPSSATLALSFVLAASTATAQRFVIDAKPALDVPGLGSDGKVLFGNVIGATILKDGSLVLADQSSLGLKFLDRQGKLVKSVGRSGKGPGEFLTLSWAGRCGADAMVTYDMAEARIQVIGPDGAVRRTSPVVRAEAPFVLSCGGGGFAVLGPPMPIPNAKPVLTGQGFSVQRAMVNAWITDSTGAKTVSLANKTVWGEVLVVGAGGMPRPLARTTQIAASASRVFLGVRDSQQVWIYNWKGERQGTITVKDPPRKPTKEMLDAAIALAVAPAPAQVRDRAIKVLSSVPPVEFLPPWNAMFTDPAGRLWLVLSAPGEATTTFRIFDETGKVLGDASLNAQVNVLEIGSDYILGIQEDAKDEPHIVKFSMRSK